VCDILKVSGLILEMVNSLEMYIIYCTTLVEILALRLQLWIANFSASKPMGKYASTVASARSAENSGVLLPLLNLDRFVVGYSSALQLFSTEN
jgi:hypothetical protein